jgi:hypothetical protein
MLNACRLALLIPLESLLRSSWGPDAAQWHGPPVAVRSADSTDSEFAERRSTLKGD